MPHIFKRTKIFRLLEGFWKKYESYGMFTGTIELRNLTEHEQEELGKFSGKIFRKKECLNFCGKIQKHGEAADLAKFRRKVLEIYFDKTGGQKAKKGCMNRCGRES